MDFSGDGAFDEDYKNMYNEAAGCPSWVERPSGLRTTAGSYRRTSLTGKDEGPQRRGLRQFDNTAQGGGEFAAVVFGTAEARAKGSRVAPEGAAGQPSWVTRQRGTLSYDRQHRKYQAFLRGKARAFLERAGLPAPGGRGTPSRGIYDCCPAWS
eukprot:SRR837773.11486.p3 GENE.SRR837773.11486~~SRR837773.11486.p3  ORF type:complete len:180 (-),score=54.45 SRR837773.11486:26-487(-)